MTALRDADENRKLRVGIVRAGWLPTNQANGVQTLEMAKAFAANGITTGVYYLPQGGTPEAVRQFHSVGESVELHPLRRALLPLRKRFDPTSALHLPGHLHAWLWGLTAVRRVAVDAPDFCYVREPSLALLLARSGYPTVLEIHGVPKSSLSSRALRAAAHHPNVAAIVTVTALLREDLAAAGLIDGERSIVLHDGVDVASFDTGLDQHQARALLGLPTDGRVVAYVGSNEQNRGVTVLEAAGPKLRDVTTLMVGPRKRAESLVVSDSTRLVWVPRVSRAMVPLYLAAADVLVLPGMNEPHHARHASPMKLFEYMAARRPIVASDLPALREVLEHNVSAWLVEPGSPDALAQGLRTVLSDASLADRLSARARADVTNYSWGQRAREIVSLATNRRPLEAEGHDQDAERE